MSGANSNTFVAVACGGTGGHLFPGMAVAEALRERACDVKLLISPKEIDQLAAKSGCEPDVETLPAVALQTGQLGAFIRGFVDSYRTARRLFKKRLPHAILAMGGFTSAPPVLAAKARGAVAFVHEANSIPGRANSWLAPWVDEAFAYFPSAARCLRNQSVKMTGMPVRPSFQAIDPVGCRIMLGLEPQRPLLLVMGGSQGATSINNLVCRALPLLSQLAPELQYLHLTGFNQDTSVRAAYSANNCLGVVKPFLTEMELALNAATLVVSRAGASSLAEFAALQLPAILIPYPAAAYDHQSHNAKAFAETGAAMMLQQQTAAPDELTREILGLLGSPSKMDAMRRALSQWHNPNAAEIIAGRVTAAVEFKRSDTEQAWRDTHPKPARRTFAVTGSFRTVNPKPAASSLL